MHTTQPAYRVLADRLLCRVFLVVAVVLAVLATMDEFTGRSDDVMRWVAVTDLLNGQSWFDPYQHRMGLGDGTLMHWSRLVDAPIAALYWVSNLVMPPTDALYFTAVAWPTLLAALTLWTITVTGGVLGGRVGAFSALLVGAFAVKYTAKFDYFAFDHHGLQILLFVAALLFFVSRRSRRHAGFWLGACLALSLSIGAEALAHIGVIGAFCALDWVFRGRAARHYILQFCAAIVGFFTLTILVSASRESFFYPGCDGLTISVALPATAAAIGLFLAAHLASTKSIWVRAVCFGVVGASVLWLAKTYAPFCLQNPIDQMPLAMREFWLSQITEAQGVTIILQRHTGETIALIGMAVFSIVAGIVFAIIADEKTEYALFVTVMLTSLVLFLYQSRMTAFLAISLVVVQAQVLRVIYTRYRTGNQRIYGVLTIVFLVFMSPKTGGSLESFFFSQTTSANQVAADPDLNQVPFTCNTQAEIERLTALSPGFVLADFDFAGNILRFTGHSVLGGNYHRNEAGNLAQIALYRSDVPDVARQLDSLDLDYVIVCKSHPRADFWTSVSDGAGLPAMFLNGDFPATVEEVDGFDDAAFQVFRVVR
ncbi:MAG: hypothetical protein AAF625_06605 [Pseudomonadota bacterium]